MLRLDQSPVVGEGNGVKTLQSNGNRSTLDVLTLSVVMAADQDRATAISLYTPPFVWPGVAIGKPGGHLYAPAHSGPLPIAIPSHRRSGRDRGAGQ